ncbi:MAG TPA: sulfite reductase subunit alpha [Roseimicrobium sp.]|nr:sulfite reductase subunit alpha [Roseimicrobium sp.]
MNSVPLLPENAPFTPEQRAWLNGYLAGLLQSSGTGPAPQTAASATKPLLVGFGSQTGTAQGLAKKLSKDAEKRGFAPVIKELNAISPADLAKTSRFVIVTSTWGDGDPPDNANAFWAQISADTAPRLENLSFAVLSLGDKNYSEFCGAGKKFDERLDALGAKRVAARAECDVDYEACATAWIESLWPALQENGATEAAATTPAAPVETADHTPVAASGYNRNNPFPAKLKANRKLNATGSAKDTRHFEIVLEGSDLTYEVGDALGVVPRNDPVLVEELLATLGCTGEELVKTTDGKDAALHAALLDSFVITQPPPSLVKAAAEKSANGELLALLAPDRKKDLDAWLWGRDIVDVLRACPAAKFSAEEFTGFLRKLQPRLYSISSSPKAHPGEVHLTVGAVRYEANGRTKKGVASCWMADRIVLNESPLPVFIQTSHGFRLPSNPETPVIMVGPGTGIAPFRAFLEERRAIGAKGKNWLFFGDQCRATDFLYDEELTAMVNDGHLTRLDLAFSRDQKEKIYVQTRMLESATELWSWLEQGAHFYVCGDAKRMAKDVDAALHEIAVKAGGKTKEQAEEYVAKLKSDKRYQRDVY